MQMGRVNPRRWWNGNQIVAEVHKCVNASPMEKAVLIMLCASIHEPKEKTKQKEVFIVSTILHLQKIKCISMTVNTNEDIRLVNCVVTEEVQNYVTFLSLTQVMDGSLKPRLQSPVLHSC
jgi:hypothetical protein